MAARAFLLLMLSGSFGVITHHVQAQTFIDGTQQSGNSFADEINATSTLRVESSDSAYTATFSDSVTVGSAGNPGTLTIQAGSGGSATATFSN
ncbi:MAG: hypothetical protein AAF418_03765, partial [Pseudomonadota bacterium]